MNDIILDPNQPTPTPADAQAPAKPALDLGPGTAPTPTAAAGDWIKDSDTQHFVKDVVEASAQTPVIVDFWAPWCGPCKTLGPLLEKWVKRSGGLIKMVKINVDENQSLAGQLRVQSVPTVFAFKDGRPVDAFAGAVPESQIQSFIEKLIGDAKPPIEVALEQGQEALKSGDGAGAEDIFSAIIDQDATITQALGGLVRAIALQGDFARARDYIASFDAKTRASADIQQALSALDLAEQGAASDPDETAALQAAVDRDAKDFTSRFALAQALFSANQPEKAIDNLLELVRLDRAWNDEAARKQLIKIFDTLGPNDPLTVDARRRLSTILFS